MYPQKQQKLSRKKLKCYTVLQEPAFTERGGTIRTYDIFYRLAQSNSESFVPFTAVLNIPHDAVGQVIAGSSSAVQVYILRELVAGQPYEVKIRAVNIIGVGPNSTEVIETPMPRKGNIMCIGLGLKLCY